MDRPMGSYPLGIDGRLAGILTMLTLAGLAAETAFPASALPIRTFSLRETVAVRETVAAATVAGGAVHLLIADRGPTGRSAVLLQADRYGGNRQWHDLKAPAAALVGAGGIVTAFSPIRHGLRLLQPTGDGARVVDLTGETALVTGDNSRLVRLLRNGDLAVHQIDGTQIGTPRILATSSTLKTEGVCSTCGSQTIIPAAYIFCLLPGGKVAVVHRSIASFKVLDLNTGDVLSSAMLENEDLRRGRSMYAALPKQPDSSRSSNPSLVIAGAVDDSGSMFLLIGPFTPAEGARVIRVDAKGEVLTAIRCTYPAFKPVDGPPQFLGVENGELYLISRTGHVSVYPLAGAKVQ